MQVEGRRRFGVNEKVIGARRGKIGDVALRLDDHEVYIERLGGCPPYGPDDHWSQRDIGHETAIHDIDMNPIRAG